MIAIWKMVALWSVPWLALAASAQQPADMPADEAEPVVGQLEHAGYVLVGPRGRHYVFGGLAVADYDADGQHKIVTLKLQEPTLLPQPDENFIYYRELGSGLRWAISRQPQADDTYPVYFQPAAPTPRWVLFHRARLIWPEHEAATGASDPGVLPSMPSSERCNLSP